MRFSPLSSCFRSIWRILGFTGPAPPLVRVTVEVMRTVVGATVRSPNVALTFAQTPPIEITGLRVCAEVRQPAVSVSVNYPRITGALT
jgi:hypothetical protein